MTDVLPPDSPIVKSAAAQRAPFPNERSILQRWGLSGRTPSHDIIPSGERILKFIVFVRYMELGRENGLCNALRNLWQPMEFIEPSDISEIYNVFLPRIEDWPDVPWNEILDPEAMVEVHNLDDNSVSHQAQNLVTKWTPAVHDLSERLKGSTRGYGGDGRWHRSKLPWADDLNKKFEEFNGNSARSMELLLYYGLDRYDQKLGPLSFEEWMKFDNRGSKEVQDAKKRGFHDNEFPNLVGDKAPKASKLEPSGEGFWLNRRSKFRELGGNDDPFFKFAMYPAKQR